MTAQRLVRGSKARIIAGLCTVVFCVAFLVLFQKTQTQLDNVNKNYEICVQQQESLSTQLQVIVDYKTRLEKSLQAEKSEHTQTRTELESRINDEKSRRDKTSMEANIRFQTLQQHYNLLQAKHEDLKEKSNKLQQQYSDEIDKLKTKIKEQQDQVQQAEKNKEKSLEHLKTLYMQLQDDKQKLAKQLQDTKTDHAKWESDLNHLTKINHQLLRQIESYKNKNNVPQHNEDIFALPGHIESDPYIKTTTRKFSKQVEVAKDVYQIRDKDDKPLEDKEESNVPQLVLPNKVEDQSAQNSVLQKPSSPSKSTQKTKTSSQANLENAAPLLVPTVTPANKIEKQENSNDFKLNSINVLPAPNLAIHKKLPPGVVPVPKQELQKPEEPQQSIKNEKTEDKIPEEINLALPNRYRNNIIESELAKEIIKETKAEVKPVNIQNEPEVNMGLDANQQDNAAMEVIDQPKNPVQEDPLHLMDVNPNVLDAEDAKIKELEHALKDPVVQLLAKTKPMKQQHIDALRAVGNGENGAIRPPAGGALYENEGDYDKEGQKEDLQIEEADPEGEEDDDGDDYDGHLVARQKEPAVRN